MINEQILSALAPLNIPIYFMEAEDNNDSIYIIFGTTGVDDSFYEDDNATAETTRVAITLWYNAEESMTIGEKVRDLKKVMKRNDFIRLSEKDLKDGNFYGRSFYFSKLQYTE
ncbi:MAG: hypothetical protein E6423_12455 [Clostridium sp.]|nr:hypothetical protein [Clostridium sp.]